MSSCLHVWSSHPLLRLRAHWSRPYVHFYIHFKHRFQVAEVFTMRWGSSVVPVHLASLSLQPHTFLSRLVILLMSSSFCLYRAHIYTTVLALLLFASVSCLESRGSFWTVLFLDVLLAGGWDTTGISRSTKRVPVGADAVGNAPLRTCSRF